MTQETQTQDTQQSEPNDMEMKEFRCQHMEADTILLYIYSQLRESGVEDAVVIDAEDTDVMVLAAYVAHQIKGTEHCA